jgi:hypothetical protein
VRKNYNPWKVQKKKGDRIIDDKGAHIVKKNLKSELLKYRTYPGGR